MESRVVPGVSLTTTRSWPSTVLIKVDFPTFGREKGTNNYLLDTEARRAILYTKQLPPLPAQFTEPSLTVHLTFDYLR